MNLKDIRLAYKHGCTIRKLHCTSCGIRKFLVPDENYNAFDLDRVSKCCKHPDYKL